VSDLALNETFSTTNGSAPRALGLGFSPCPNDTFMFHALVHGRVEIPDCRVSPVLHDVETLNEMARHKTLELTKLSFFALFDLAGDYRLLNAGAAMGHGCGPILVARRAMDPRSLPRCRVVVPGQWTTAHLLFRLWAPQAGPCRFIPYDRIMAAIGSGEADCGVIIHENRFTYHQYGLVKIVDLGEWWESQTGLPIPLGCIAARADLPEVVIQGAERAIRASIAQARQAPQASLAYIHQHAREMEPSVLERHIETFVNDYSLDLGEAGRAAVAVLQERARKAGVLP